MDAKAVKLIDLVLQWEGGYADTSFDGHETYRGITRDNYPTWCGWPIVDSYKPLKHNQIIKNTTLENHVREFYYKYYYKPMKIMDLDNLLTSGHVFSMGVNAGSKASIKLLQKAINKVYCTSIAVDGIIGNITLSYANGDRKNEVATELVNQCYEYYETLATRNPYNKKFLNGWRNRVKGVTDACTNTLSILTTLFTTEKNKLFDKILSFILKIIKQFIK